MRSGPFHRVRAIAAIRNAGRVSQALAINISRHIASDFAKRRSAMNKGVALVGGVGLGAALMYIFDPDRGGRRRALIRDKVVAAGNKAGDVAGKVSRDLRNRADGIVAETKSLFKHEEVPDDVLDDRVRSKLGRYAFNIVGLEVRTLNGTVTLLGRVKTELVPKVLRAVRMVRGVKEVDNQLELSNETAREEATDSSFQIQSAAIKA